MKVERSEIPTVVTGEKCKFSGEMNEMFARFTHPDLRPPLPASREGAGEGKNEAK